MRSWKRLVIALLRAALQGTYLKSQMSHDEIEGLLQYEEIRHWKVHVQAFDGKEHFLCFAGRYVRRPPIAERRIVSVANGIVRSGTRTSAWADDKP
jgi:Putative transposase